MCKPVLLLLLACLAGSGCRNLYYSTMEKFGKEKRNLLQTKVEQVRNTQTEATQQLKDALTRLQELYSVPEGKLNSFYKDLKSDYDRSEGQAQDLRNRVQQMDQIANDLFKEWEKESGEMTSEDLRTQSRRLLTDTRTRYDDLHASNVRAQGSMDSVLKKFRDYVLFLKHNLNAQAISSLKGEANKIQVDMSKLIEEMNASIRQADQFIKGLKE